MRKAPRTGAERFLSTLSLRRATAAVAINSTRSANFYPRSPCGERPVPWACAAASSNFYPRSPCGERHIPQGTYWINTRISIHALLAESDLKAPLGTDRGRISIHALLAESDFSCRDKMTASQAISIHALLAESDGPILAYNIDNENFYPRSPCGERLLFAVRENMADEISIHALLAESDRPLR